MGFIEFDGIRYWDYRHVTPFKADDAGSFLQSDHNKRMDKHLL
jgi:hypothetical protein